MTRFSPNLLILALGGAALALGGCSGKQAEPAASEAAATEPTAASADWTAQNPTDPAVPVNLPKTEMTNVPAEPATPAANKSAPAK